MRYWLLKSEPGVFSIDDLAASPARTTAWDGVRNYQARNNLRAMRLGDRVFFYHSNADPSAIVGTAEVVREAYPDPNDERWSWADIRFLAKFPRPVSLAAVKEDSPLKNMVLAKNSRLSVQPVAAAEWTRITRLALGAKRRLSP